MSKKPITPQAYFGLRMREDGVDWSQFSYGTSFDNLKTWATDESSEKEDRDLSPKPSSVEGESDGDTKTALAELMNKVVDSGFALSELVISSSAVKGVFSGIIARAEVVDPIREAFELAEEGNNYKIYAISAERLTKVREQHRRLVRMDKGFDLLPSAVLLTIVATFDSMTSDIVRRILNLYPERVNSSDKSISVADILSMSSFDEVREKLIDDEIYSFSRGGHDEQVKDIEKWFHIRIAEGWKRWPDFIEIFERRNLIAHGEKTFTKRYVAICSKHGHKGFDKTLGTDIELSPTYLSQALDILIEFGILLVFSIWRKLLPEQESEAFETVNETCYRLITDERYRVPVRAIEYVLSLKNTKVSQATRLMLTVNLASAHMHRNDKENGLKVLDGVDWSAVSDNYKICVAALRRDIDEVVNLMQVTTNAGTIRKIDFRECPVFSFVRSEEKFQQKFMELFAENLFDSNISSEKIVSEKEAAAEVIESEESMH